MTHCVAHTVLTWPESGSCLGCGWQQGGGSAIGCAVVDDWASSTFPAAGSAATIRQQGVYVWV
jgi:hypothetical protein